MRDTDRNLARRSRGTKTGLVAAICIVVSLAGVGTVFLIAQISNLKNELSGVRRELIGARAESRDWRARSKKQCRYSATISLRKRRPRSN